MGAEGTPTTYQLSAKTSARFTYLSGIVRGGNCAADEGEIGIV